MRQLASLFVVVAMLAPPLVLAQQPDAVASAVEAANRWLVAADAGDGAATWDQAAPLFQAAMPKAGWTDALKTARQPLGTVKSRKVASSVFTRSLPGAPDGEYVLIQYDTQFANRGHAVETVVPMRDRDGKWKVSGYYVR